MIPLPKTMKYRTFPKVPATPVSTLGFGCMRLPVIGGDFTRIDEELATSLLHKAIDAGVNYVDTAYAYHGGQSEPFLGRALDANRRAKVLLASKAPVWLVHTESDWERFLDEQLKKLGTSCIDFYLLHALNAERWETVRRLNGLAALERARSDGRIRHIGFSFHGSPDAFRKIIDAYEWEFSQIQYNFLDEEFQAGTAGLQLAARKGVGIAVMEPLRGGALTKAPEPVQQLWQQSGRSWTPAEWALRWLWDRPEVVTVLSGMNALDQLQENLNAANSADAGALTPKDHQTVRTVREWYEKKLHVPCTTCGYCQPCPNRVAISDILSLRNSAAMFDSKEAPSFIYNFLFVRQGMGAESCLDCGECAPKCPQGIAIPEQLKEAHAHLTAPQPKSG